jgi:hypothetical protein
MKLELLLLLLTWKWKLYIYKYINMDMWIFIIKILKWINFVMKMLKIWEFENLRIFYTLIFS